MTCGSMSEGSLARLSVEERRPVAAVAAQRQRVGASFSCVPRLGRVSALGLFDVGREHRWRHSMQRHNTRHRRRGRIFAVIEQVDLARVSAILAVRKGAAHWAGVTAGLMWQHDAAG